MSFVASDKAFFGSGHIELQQEMDITKVEMTQTRSSKIVDDDILYQLTADDGKQVL